MYDLIVFNNRKEWKLNNKGHRKEGPAIEWKNTRKKIWMIDGKRHRNNNLPAIEYPDGNKDYYLNGQKYKFYDNGTKEYFDFFSRLHRFDFPAIEYSNGDKEWWMYGRRHRLNGPAVIIGDKKFWFEHGEFIKCSI